MVGIPVADLAGQFGIGIFTKVACETAALTASRGGHGILAFRRFGEGDARIWRAC